eukprot:gnl/Dysnectes_brevis/7948_a13790_370.p2 GENE.gnl/Dysnectes_brevis/7948_a13790_370~~gnl/Dysnectes_brevis/7948_a13790_370.p2  ORF type:complete len:117 (+),score=13.15 gnl/Dysnectes_brevis/7948_a13790_370:65-415(+)
MFLIILLWENLSPSCETYDTTDPSICIETSGELACPVILSASVIFSAVNMFITISAVLRPLQTRISLLCSLGVIGWSISLLFNEFHTSSDVVPLAALSASPLLVELLFAGMKKISQ